jgi:hypothetical protein
MDKKIRQGNKRRCIWLSLGILLIVGSYVFADQINTASAQTTTNFKKLLHNDKIIVEQNNSKDAVYKYIIRSNESAIKTPNDRYKCLGRCITINSVPGDKN